MSYKVGDKIRIKYLEAADYRNEYTEDMIGKEYTITQAHLSTTDGGNSGGYNYYIGENAMPLYCKQVEGVIDIPYTSLGEPTIREFRFI